jgi:hypothetical protein
VSESTPGFKLEEPAVLARDRNAMSDHRADWDK